MTTHQVPAGTMAGTAATITPKEEPRPITLDEFLETIADDRVKQLCASAVYNACGSRIAYQCLGLAATMQATARETAEHPITAAEALAVLDDEAERAKAMDSMGMTYTDRANLIATLMRVRYNMQNLIEQSWPDFKGRGIDEELARTIEPRAINPADIDAIHEHLEGAIDKSDIVAGLKSDYARDASQAKERIHLATIIAHSIDIADPGAELSAEDELRMMQRVEAALQRFEIECLTGRARGFSNSIERLATAKLGKDLRKRLNAIARDQRRFHREDAKDPVAPTSEQADLRSSETIANRQQIVANQQA